MALRFGDTGKGIRRDLEVKSDGSVSVSAQMIDPRTIPGAYISGQFFLNGVNITSTGDNLS